MSQDSRLDRFTDSLANLVGEAAKDIRQRVLEEGWFGRVTSGPPNFYESFWARHGTPDTWKRDIEQQKDHDRSPDIGR